MTPLRVVPLQLPVGIFCVLVHPHLEIETRYARSVLKAQVSLQDHVQQSARLGAFVAACYRSDHALLKESLNDLIIEPQRSHLIPGFFEAKKAALENGALGFSISGSGPSVFAWASSQNDAQKISAAVCGAFQATGLKVDSWISPLGTEGARVIA